MSSSIPFGESLVDIIEIWENIHLVVEEIMGKDIVWFAIMFCITGQLVTVFSYSRVYDT